MGYIDDATNRVYVRFYDYEGTMPAMDIFTNTCSEDTSLLYFIPSIYLSGLLRAGS